MLALLALISTEQSLAGTLQCNSYSGGVYCQYDGRVAAAYVNAGNQILVYFDESFSPAIPAQVGLSVGDASSAVVPISDNPDFAKMFYASLLTAQAQDKNVTIQMHSTFGGNLRADRIWVR